MHLVYNSRYCWFICMLFSIFTFACHNSFDKFNSISCVRLQFIQFKAEREKNHTHNQISMALISIGSYSNWKCLCSARIQNACLGYASTDQSTTFFNMKKDHLSNGIVSNFTHDEEIDPSTIFSFTNSLIYISISFFLFFWLKQKM